MIKKFPLIAFVTVLLIVSFLIGQWYGGSGSINRLKPTSSESFGGEGFSLSDEQLNKLLDAASNGDINAMRKIYFYYEFSLADHAESEKWQRIMANAGDTLSQQALIKNYLIADDPVIRREGAQLCRTWLVRSKTEQLP